MEFRKQLNAFIKVAFRVMVVLLVVYVTIAVSTVGYDFGYRVFTEPAMEEKPGEDIIVEVKQGTTGKELGVQLEEKGLVRDADLFYLQLKLSAYSGKIRTGTYTLNTSMTAKEMMVIMSSAKSSTRTGE